MWLFALWNLVLVLAQVSKKIDDGAVVKISMETELDPAVMVAMKQMMSQQEMDKDKASNCRESPLWCALAQLSTTPKSQKKQRDHRAMDAHGHHDMDGMNNMAPPPSSSSSSSSMDMHHHNHNQMVMHMSFYWGREAEVLFSNWPGSNSGMYLLSLVFVFVLSFLVEWLSHCGLMKHSSGSGSVWLGLVRTFVHAVRVGLAYLVMLAVMSFNIGVFLVAVGGHALGFLVFGSRAFSNKSPPPGNWEGL